MPSSHTINAREVARILDVAESTLYDHLNRTGHINGIPGIRIGRRWLFSRHKIEQLVGPLPEDGASDAA